MLGIALDLGRSAPVALDEQAGTDAAEWPCGSKVQRLPGHDLLGLPDVGENFLGWLAGAGAESGERERRAHQLQELAAPERIEHRCLARELALQELAEPVAVGELLEAAPIVTAAGLRQTRADGWQ